MAQLGTPSNSNAQPSEAGRVGHSRIANSIDVVLGGCIRASRIAGGLSQTELGQRVGVSFQQVQKYERGANRISASMLVLLAAALGVSAAELLAMADGASRTGIAPDLACDAQERELLNSFRSVSSRMKRKAIVDLVVEIAKG